MKILNIVSRIITGLLFISSASCKANDPSGFSFKLQDYFHAFDVPFLDDLSMMLTILLCTFEFLAGFSVLLNIKFRTGIWIIMLLMIIFTPLTLVIALINPVSDCGCFGDCVHLTNWQTFWKNIILLIPFVYLFINRKNITPHISSAREWVLTGITAVLFIAFIFYNIRYLPLIDFLPYSTGTYIPDKMIIPEGMQTDRYETTFIYEKNGEKKEFDITNYPEGDSTWKFIDQKSVLVSRGYQPPIHDFILTTPEHEDLTDMILESERYTLLMVTRKIGEADPRQLSLGFETGRFCIENSIDFYILTASGKGEIRNTGVELPWCLVDETTLKTMIRSNPGYLLLKKGTILHKWSWASLPDNETLLEITGNYNNNNNYEK